ncbi:hypothetical protein [Parasphingopyxis marina]|uniref:Uncharacterized protein n=1 Tax=Parasphingopyxis marina TaxID=2761622 RepID=A0A842HVS3_9SPHN|nr:hypothetical protein [Parasphingopyxis marina]MBC2776359.1 hypothetical protein [Parasphingopyxis marina]
MARFTKDLPQIAMRDDVRAELLRAFAAPQFERSPVMRRLLSFLVEKAAQGEGARLKAYTIAVDALGRPPNFDTQADSYPRVQVGRLRKLLDAYYAECGIAGDVRFHIPKGGYEMRFEASAVPEPAPSVPAAPESQDPPPPFAGWTGWEIFRFAAVAFLAVIIGLLAWQGLEATGFRG